MSSIRRLKPWLVAAGTLALTAAEAATPSLDQWGTLASISSYACVDQACDPEASPAATLLFLNSLAVAPIDGGVGQTAAAAATAVTWPEPGSASSTATAAGGFGVPVLKAGASAGAGQWLAGQALAVQGYTYTGAGETLSLTWNLTGNVTNPDGDAVTGLVIYAGFFTSTELPTFPDVGDPGALALLFVSDALNDPADNVVSVTTSGGVNRSGTISLDVTPGQVFYLAMGLMAGAGGSGALAESLSTFDGDFVGAPALTPAFVTTPVPLPPAAWLLAGALGGLVTRRRTTARR